MPKKTDGATVLSKVEALENAINKTLKGLPKEADAKKTVKSVEALKKELDQLEKDSKAADKADK